MGEAAGVGVSVGVGGSVDADRQAGSPEVIRDPSWRLTSLMGMAKLIPVTGRPVSVSSTLKVITPIA